MKLRKSFRLASNKSIKKNSILYIYIYKILYSHDFSKLCNKHSPVLYIHRTAPKTFECETSR